MITEIFSEKKITKAQAKLDREKRILNISDAFAIRDPSLFKDKSILIIDDVSTTGETINQCAKVLRETGAKNVYGLTIARDV